MSKFSVITVCRNAEKDIGRTINSVLSQDSRDYEYIIIDGASTDNTISIVKQYGKKIAKFISEPDTGIYQAMNKGIGLATGKYLLFLNAGDLFLHERILSVMAGQIEQNPADVLYGDLLITDMHKGSTLYRNSVRNMHKFWLYRHNIFHQSAFIRRELFAQAGLYDESFSLAGDHEWFVRLFTHYKNICPYYYDFCAALFAVGGRSAGGLQDKRLCKELALIRDKYYGLGAKILCSQGWLYQVWWLGYRIWRRYKLKTSNLAKCSHSEGQTV
ncbi:glycosyl transferase group 2 [Candidatus Termititenax persephonae]|uniref:Glycosyl transferase group 2 n=1 Tax=Candidatus Termititenax persephonae TaxID=2218525 RepID=A0A388TFI9_9BACT|nr:glycosyl transferase group 2 [Candidatus Termititenax persephonae]